MSINNYDGTIRSNLIGDAEAPGIAKRIHAIWDGRGCPSRTCGSGKSSSRRDIRL